MQTPDGESYGPVNKQELDQWVAEGSVAPDSKIWQAGDPQHRRARELYPELVSGPGEPVTDEINDFPLDESKGRTEQGSEVPRSASRKSVLMRAGKESRIAPLSTEELPEDQFDAEAAASAKRTILWTSILTGIIAIFCMIMTVVYAIAPKTAKDPPFMFVLVLSVFSVQAVWATCLSWNPIWQLGKKLLNRIFGVIPEGLGCFVFVNPVVLLFSLYCCCFVIPLEAAGFYANFGGGIYQFLRNWELSNGRRVLIYGKPFRFWQCLLAQMTLNAVFVVLLLISMIGRYK